MKVKSRDYRDGRMVEYDVAAPLPRAYLDSARTPARVLFGVLFVAYSSIGTVVGVQGDLAPALAHRADGLIIGYALGFGLALLIFIAELLLAEVSPFWYSVVLIPDVWYTYRFSGWIGAIIRANVEADSLVVGAAVVIITSLFSLTVAYMGERLLFGRRRS